MSWPLLYKGEKIVPEAHIIGLGHYVPENIVTNDDLSKIMDTSDQWILDRIGITKRQQVDVSGEIKHGIVLLPSKKPMVDITPEKQ